jgi:hypothetical protein
MPNPIRKTVILAKLEVTYGTDPTPAPATDALIVSNQSIKPLVAQNVERNIVTGNLGQAEQLVGPAYVEATFDVEIAGSGTPTTAPAWGKLLKACGFSEQVQTASVDYTPISDISGVASTSAALYYYLAGRLYKLLGARGTFSMEMGVGERPVFRFRFIGRNGGLTAVALPSPTLTAWRTPVIVTDTNTADLLLGAVTYTAATGVVSGGTAFTGKGLQVDIANNVVFQPLVGAETVEIVARQVAGKISRDMSAAQAVSDMADILANTTTGLGFTHGTTAGNIVVVHAPKVQRINPDIENLNENALDTADLRFTPSSGNDEIRIVSR